MNWPPWSTRHHPWCELAAPCPPPLEFRQLFKLRLVVAALGASQERLGPQHRCSSCREPLSAEAICPPVFAAMASNWEATLREASVSPDDCQCLSRAFLYPRLELDPEVAE